MKMRGSGASSSVKMRVSRTDYLGALANRFAFGLAAVNRPWAATERLEDIKINFEKDGLRSGKNCKMVMLWSGFFFFLFVKI